MIEIKNENDFVVTDESGNQKLMKILFYFHNDERNRDYYFIYEESNPDELVVVATEDGESMATMSDEEYDECEQVLSAYDEDPKIAEAK